MSFYIAILTEEKPVGEEASLAILVSWTQRKAIFSKDQWIKQVIHDN